MVKLKEWLLGALGGVGFLVFFLIVCTLNILPILILDFPLWAIVLICFALSFFEWAQFLYLGVWIWALVVALGSPINWFSIVYFVACFIYFGNIILSVISAIRGD